VYVVPSLNTNCGWLAESLPTNAYAGAMNAYVGNAMKFQTGYGNGARMPYRKNPAGRAANRRSNVEPAIIDSDAHESKLGLLQQIARGDISGILDPNLDAGLEQGLNDQAKGPLEAGRDQNLISGTCDIPRNPQIARNCEPQRLVTHATVQVGIDHLLVIELTRYPHDDLRP